MFLEHRHYSALYQLGHLHQHLAIQSIHNQNQSIAPSNVLHKLRPWPSDWRLLVWIWWTLWFRSAPLIHPIWPSSGPFLSSLLSLLSSDESSNTSLGVTTWAYNQAICEKSSWRLSQRWSCSVSRCLLTSTNPRIISFCALTCSTAIWRSIWIAPNLLECECITMSRSSRV